MCFDFKILKEMIILNIFMVILHLFDKDRLERQQTRGDKESGMWGVGVMTWVRGQNQTGKVTGT